MTWDYTEANIFGDEEDLLEQALRNRADPNVLSQDVDYLLPVGSSCWITVGGISLFVNASHGVLSAQLFGLGQEDAHPIDEASVVLDGSSSDEERKDS
jgi:hypothetical protein